MKILYYIHALYVGGAETLITNYLLRLREMGNDVVLVVNQEEDSFLAKALTEKEIKIIPLNAACRTKAQRYLRLGLRKIFGYRKTWKKIYCEEKPDIVHIHTFLDAFEMGGMDPQKVFFSFHTKVERALSLSGKKNLRKLQKYTKLGMNFTALSRSMVSDLEEKIQAKNIFYIPNGVDLQKIRSARYSKNAFLQEHGLPADAFIVGHVGRFHPVKNHEKLFRVFCEVHKKRPHARLLLVGSGSPEEVAHVKNLLAKHGLSDAVLMLGIRPDATAIMSVFDAFVLPSFSEGFPLVMLEAQAQGVRCVASTAVPAEVICENCVSLDIKDSDEAWANAILAERFPASRNKVEQFDIALITKKLSDLYHSVTAENGQRS